MKRLLPKEIAYHRARLLEEQNRTCPMCGEEIRSDDRVHLDHNHKTGLLRSSLHGACNLSLGKLERAARMTRNPKAFLENAPGYIKFHEDFPAEFLHPSHLTREEKAERLRRRHIRRRKREA